MKMIRKCILLTMTFLTLLALSACGGKQTSLPTDEPATQMPEPTATPTPTPIPDPTSGLEYVLNEDGGSYSLAGFGRSTDKNIVVASEHEGLPVTAIGAHAFEESEIESIFIPDSVTEIKEFAFSRALKLSYVRLPINIEIIGNQAFMAAPIEGELVLPETLTYLGNGAFHGSKFTKITLNKSLTKIRDNAFSCSSELEAVIIPEGATYAIADKMFRECPKITEITIPEGICEVSEEAFIACTALKRISLPQSVTKIGAGAFKNCTALEEVIIPNTVTRINTETFNNCTSLQRIIFDGTEEEWDKVRKNRGWIDDGAEINTIFAK